MPRDRYKIAIIGAGVAGSTIAIYLGRLGLDIALFERGDSIVNGPPFCHLHAGGNLYREISDEACITLLRESIELLRTYPNAIDYRPTVLAVPKIDPQEPKDMFARLERLKRAYEELIERDIGNRVLSDISEYYKTYTQDDIKALSEMTPIDNPSSLDEWMIPVAKSIDFSKIKFPIIMVQEYGLNIFRLSASANLSIEQMNNISLQLNTEVIDIEKTTKAYHITFDSKGKTQREEFDYIINAAGFRSGTIDDMLSFLPQRLVEFKSAYISKWSSCQDIWPEVIFFGTRGTPMGMGQFTPYPDGYFQIHGMTEDITLFPNGLAKSSDSSAQPKLDDEFIEKIEHGWNKEEIDLRTQKAIEHIREYIPTLRDIEVASKPLYGAQQIPGGDVSLRTADVSFPDSQYARCEIVKASSVLTMSDLIIKKLIELGFVDEDSYRDREHIYKKPYDTDLITNLAQELCRARDYPIELARVSRPQQLSRSM